MIAILRFIYKANYYISIPAGICSLICLILYWFGVNIPVAWFSIWGIIATVSFFENFFNSRDELALIKELETYYEK